MIAHQVASLGLEYGTIVPMHYMNPDGFAKVVSVASPLFTSFEESRILGEATRRGIDASGERAAILASGSLSHRLWPNKKLGPEAWTSVASEFNRQVDLRVLELWQGRRYREFLDMLPDYATKCNGEGGMADTIMLFAALGWYDYRGAASSSATIFRRPAPARSTWSFTSRREACGLTPVSPHWRCGPVRRTPCGRPRPARRRPRESADASDLQSTAAAVSWHGPCWSTIPVPD